MMSAFDSLPRLRTSQVVVATVSMRQHRDSHIHRQPRHRPGLRLALGYEFDGCSGQLAFASLDVPVSSPGSNRAVSFFYSSGALGGPNHVQILGAHSPAGTASGNVSFTRFADCQGTNTTWSATRP